MYYNESITSIVRTLNTELVQTLKLKYILKPQVVQSWTFISPNTIQLILGTPLNTPFQVEQFNRIIRNTKWMIPQMETCYRQVLKHIYTGPLSLSINTQVFNNVGTITETLILSNLEEDSGEIHSFYKNLLTSW